MILEWTTEDSVFKWTREWRDGQEKVSRDREEATGRGSHDVEDFRQESWKERKSGRNISSTEFIDRVTFTDFRGSS